MDGVAEEVEGSEEEEGMELQRQGEMALSSSERMVVAQQQVPFRPQDFWVEGGALVGTDLTLIWIFSS